MKVAILAKNLLSAGKAPLEFPDVSSEFGQSIDFRKL